MGATSGCDVGVSYFLPRLVGASLAAGCTVGHGLTGVPLLAPGSIVAIIAIFAGSAVTSLWGMRAAAAPSA